MIHRGGIVRTRVSVSLQLSSSYRLGRQSHIFRGGFGHSPRADEIVTIGVEMKAFLVYQVKNAEHSPFRRVKVLNTHELLLVRLSPQGVCDRSTGVCRGREVGRLLFMH